jgi:hypothetical protein
MEQQCLCTRRLLLRLPWLLCAQRVKRRGARGIDFIRLKAAAQKHL